MSKETKSNNPFYLEKQQQQKHPVPRSDDLLREASTTYTHHFFWIKLAYWSSMVVWASWVRLSSCPDTGVFCCPLLVNPAAELPTKKALGMSVVALVVGCCFLFVYLFIFGHTRSSLLPADFLQMQWVRASHCSGFSCCRTWALEHEGFSRCGVCT